MKATKITIKLTKSFPQISAFSNFNDVEFHKDELNKLGFKAKSLNIAYDGKFWGLFYRGTKKPNARDIVKSLKEQNFNFNKSELYTRDIQRAAKNLELQ